MNLKLWTVSGAPSPWRVALALAFKGVSSEIHMLSASKKEHKSVAYRDLNHRGTVPTLEADELKLRHSIAILAWLDREFPAKPLFGDSPEQAGQIWQTTMEVFDYLPSAASRVLSPIFFHDASEVTDELSSGANGLRNELSHLSDILISQPFLSGDRPGAADAVTFPHIRLIQRAMETKPGIMNALGLGSLVEISPAIAAWVSSVEALPGVAETFPPHWAETD